MHEVLRPRSEASVQGSAANLGQGTEAEGEIDMPEFNILILCPWHGGEETLRLPESYFAPGVSSFEGDVPCAGPRPAMGGQFILHMLIRFNRGAYNIERLEKIEGRL